MLIILFGRKLTYDNIVEEEFACEFLIVFGLDVGSNVVVLRSLIVTQWTGISRLMAHLLHVDRHVLHQILEEEFTFLAELEGKL